MIRLEKSSGKYYENKQRKLRHELCEAKTLDEFDNIKRKMDLNNSTNKEYIEKFEPKVIFQNSRMFLTLQESQLSYQIKSVLHKIYSGNLDIYYRNYIVDFDTINYRKLYDEIYKKVKENELPWSVDQAVMGIEYSRGTGRMSTKLDIQMRRMNIDQIIDMIAAIALNNTTISEIEKYIYDEKRLLLIKDE